MHRFLKSLTRLAVPLALMVLAAPLFAQSVDIANGPLFAAKQSSPNVVVTTSVEFPTVGAAYLNVQYLPANTYQGYFNPAFCYLYNYSNGGSFYPTSPAVNHECVAQFSGNFMNWLTMSAIDEFRFAMTGGNRVDENGDLFGTVIQRAYLPDGTVGGVPDFYGLGSNFPGHAIGANGYIDGYMSSLTSRVLPPMGTVLPPTLVTDASIVYMKNCKTQVYFSLSNSGNCANPAAELGTFNVRVNVCNTVEALLRTDLCLQYGAPTGKFKPVGQVQLNADGVRFASFGYLMDHDVPGYSAPYNNGGWNEGRYGGVLRSPMKYVGPTTYSANAVPTSNANAEIDSQGRLIADPEGTASSVGGQYSGFINFLNKFGSSGVYKRYDPAGEMFYEAIRYYQNLGPTPEATVNLPTTTSAKNLVLDNFPITTAWVDPIISSCSANYIINLSDANTWDDTYLPGFGTSSGSLSAGTGRPAARAPQGGLDAFAWAANIGNLESTISSIATNDVRPGLANIATQHTANNASWAVAGAAYWAHVNDIRSDLPGTQTITTISFDVAEASIDIHDRQLYLMGKYGGFKNNLDRASDTFAEPFYTADPVNSQNPAIRSNSEWADSTGLPNNYLLASDPDKLINGIKKAFAQIQAGSGTLNGAALTSNSLVYGASGAFVATFDPNYWSGTVQERTVSLTGTTVTTSAAAVWDAGMLLTNRCGSTAPYLLLTTCTEFDTSSNKRNIITTIRSGSTRVAAPFTWANVSTDSQYAGVLNTNPNTQSADGLGQRRLNYLRGYRNDETTSNPLYPALPFRTRNSALGDIINSGPVYEGAPVTSISDSDYQPFYANNVNRTPAVYVGANDGMMHAFNANTGTELFAYIPNFVNFDLNDLTKQGYVHEPFVDAVAKVQEAKVNGAWKTVLVSGVGAGAQGVFALDVSDPSSFGTGNVIFEFSDADDADLGNVLSAPEIVKLQTGGTSTAPTYGYFAVVTGYNNRRTTFPSPAVPGITPRTDTSVSSDTNNRGVLFLLSLDRTLGTAWSLNGNYFKYFFPANDPNAKNGLGPVVAVPNKNGSGAASALYFGDLQGDLWRFNTVGLQSAWTPALGSVTSPLPLFKAAIGTVKQPITARPQISTGPFGSQFVYFGTGEYLGTTDLSTPYAQQSQYAFIDNNSASTTITRADLVALSVTAGNVTGPAGGIVYSGNGANKGWYLDFPNSVGAGERSITQPAINAGQLSFTTLTLSSNVCGAGGGYIYQINALQGYGVTTLSPVGIPGPPKIVDLVISSGQNKATGETISTHTTTTLVSGTSGDIKGTTQVVSKAPPTGRVNWRELTNYNDVHP